MNIKNLHHFAFAVKCTLLFLLTSIPSPAQVNSFPEIRSDDISNVQITRTEYFDGTSLWGYIDGAADVYLEYGFNKLLVQDLSWNNHKFVINIYQMNNPEAAFGIYSISQHKCNPFDSLFTCITSHQIQFAKSDFYVSIINELGLEEEQNFNIRLMDVIKDKIGGFIFDVPHLFTNTDLYKYSNNLKFFSGTLGLQNGYPDWLDLFEGIDKYEMYFLSVEQNDKYINIASIKFLNENELKRFSKNSAELKKNNFHFHKKGKNNRIYFLQSNKSENELTDFIELLK